MTRSRITLTVLCVLCAVAWLVAACGSSGSGSAGPTPTPEPLPVDVLVRAIAAYRGPTGTLQAPGDTLTTPLSVEGITQAVAITGGDPPCPGWVNTVPDYVFRVAADLSTVEVSFDGTTTGTLLVVTPQGARILCSDAITARPSLTIAQPAQGTYAVLVGRGNLSGANAGRLTVTGQ